MNQKKNLYISHRSIVFSCIEWNIKNTQLKVLTEDYDLDHPWWNKRDEP